MCMSHMIILIPIIPVISLMVQHSNLLMALMSIEGIMLMMMLSISLIMLMSKLKMYSLIIVMLSMSACEASIGLSLMVMMSRLTGSDLLKSINTNKC